MIQLFSHPFATTSFVAAVIVTTVVMGSCSVSEQSRPAMTPAITRRAAMDIGADGDVVVARSAKIIRRGTSHAGSVEQVEMHLEHPERIGKQMQIPRRGAVVITSTRGMFAEGVKLA